MLLDRLKSPAPKKSDPNQMVFEFDQDELYNLTQVEYKYSISESALQNLIKRLAVPKVFNLRLV